MADLVHITHESIPIFIDDESKILILGSLPSIKSREEGFFYAHKRNRFFLTLSGVFKENEPLSIEERKLFLKRHKIALYDVVYECDIHASSDASITNVKVIDIKNILSSYPNIKKIAINGGKARQLFDRYLLQHIDTSSIKIYYLPSTSPANARIKIEELIDNYSIIFE